MGSYHSLLKKIGLRNEEMRILFMGLDAAGKTTILYKLKLGEVVTTIPTIGFNVETIEHKKTYITAWDVGGRDKIRPLYRHYFANTQGLVYVIDSNDRDRIKEAKEELFRFLREDELRDCSLLIMANKQDLANALTVQEVIKEISFDEIKHSRKNIIGTIATQGEGLYQGLDWLIDSFNNKSYDSNFLTQPLKETVNDVKKISDTATWSFYLSNLPSKLFKLIS